MCVVSRMSGYVVSLKTGVTSSTGRGRITWHRIPSDQPTPALRLTAVAPRKVRTLWNHYPEKFCSVLLLLLKHMASVLKTCKKIVQIHRRKKSNSRPLDETIQHCPLVFQGTTCTLRHQGHVFKGTRLACSLHSLTWPQSRAPRVLAESHTVSPSSTTWRAIILVSGTTENNMLKHTCNLSSHGSYHINITTLYTFECILALSGTRGNSLLDPCPRNLCVRVMCCRSLCVSATA